MRELSLNFKAGERLQILCIGAHSDDIEIGCGGTILRLLADNSNCAVHWVVLSATGERGDEARNSAEQFLQGAAEKQIHRKEFRDGFFPHSGAPLKDYFEELKRLGTPDLIFTHYRHDLHQDHRVACELTWNTFRNHLILEYEIPKYDGDLGSPNFFVALDDDTLNTKIRYLFECFQTQSDNHWFCKELFRSLPRLRGMECALKGKYAEAFYCRKLRLFG